MVVGQERGESRRGVLQLGNLRCAQLLNRHRAGAAQFVECLLGQPVRFLDGELTPRRCDHREAGHLSGFANEIDNGQALFLGKEIEAIDEKDRPAAGGQIHQEIAGAPVESQCSSQLRPPAGLRAAWTQHDDSRLGGTLLRQVLQQARFADARIATDFDITAFVESCADSGDMIFTYQRDIPDTVNDVRKRVACIFCKSIARDRIPPVTSQAERPAAHVLDQLGAGTLSRARSDLDRELDQVTLESFRPSCLTGMQRTDGAFPFQGFGRGPRRREIEDQNLELRQ